MKIVEFLRDWLYPRQFEMIPGEFESFLTGVTEISELSPLPTRSAGPAIRRS